MKMISITIPIVKGTYLREVLESIKSQTWKDYEIIGVNDTGNQYVSELLKEYGAKEIVLHSGSLYARYIASVQAKGDYILLLDETRFFVDNECLREISENQADVIFLKEMDVTENFWTRASAIDKDYSFSEYSINEDRGYILPRCYKKDVLISAMENVKLNLKDKFFELTAPEDLLTYEEAKRMIKSKKIIKRTILMHYGDASLKQIIKKYYRYGKDYGSLLGTKYFNIKQIGIIQRIKGRLNKKIKISELFLLILLYTARGIPFVIGREIGKFNVKISQHKKSNYEG